MDSKSEILDFYNGSNILITGGTGFMGKILIDKLLRTCSGINNIYLVIRIKKGKESDLRLKELFNDPVFNRLKTDVPDFRNKVTCISGDCGAKYLGMSESDRNMLSSVVTNVFHGAATVKFNEKLKLAVNINVRGVKEMLNFCKTCPNLKSVVHISTAFSNCPQKEISEEFYEPPMSGDDAINLVSIFDDDKLEKITPLVIGAWPNTYAFTKAVAEDIVKVYGKGLPMGVFRPAIGVGAGLIRTFYADRDVKSDLVPVDYAVNALICCGREVATKFNNNTYQNDINYENDKYVADSEHAAIPIYNFVSSVHNPLTWGEYLNLNMKHGRKVPTIKAIWYYTLTITKVKFWYYVMFILFHVLPGLIMDGGLMLAGKKPMMLNAYKKILKFTNVIGYFSTKQWSFDNSNTLELWNKLNTTDRLLFNYDMKKLDWSEYFKKNVWGIRIYLLNDKVETLQTARKKMLMFYVAHRILQLVLIGLFAWIMYGLYCNLLFSYHIDSPIQSVLQPRRTARKITCFLSNHC